MSEPSDRRAENERQNPADRAADPGRTIRVCPNCGATLSERKCKLVCPEPRCGYYLSCSDYY